MNTAFSCLEASCNPFALMVNQDRVLAAVHGSGQLNALASKVFRPLGELPAFDNDEERLHDTAGAAAS